MKTLTRLTNIITWVITTAIFITIFSIPFVWAIGENLVFNIVPFLKPHEVLCDRIVMWVLMPVQAAGNILLLETTWKLRRKVTSEFKARQAKRDRSHTNRRL